MLDNHKGSFSKRSGDFFLYSKQFKNGDSYTGQWKDDKPDGDGKYVWEMGSWYEGTWQCGKQHGVGKYVWPSGATYQGEWRAGSIHGVGTMTSPTPRLEPNPSYANPLGLSLSFGGPGTRNQHLVYSTGTISRYQGSWVADKRHGLGKQIYAKGDIYEGLWKQDLQDGPGRYMFTSGDEYDGEWREGLMSGQGTFVWSGGERYDGHWKVSR
ncbi:putative phosphatidylinositol monophosphate kinase [Dunaliella salina]|uniref:Phosphatidylinositol monophosphate kinase n=1 Tax=Dunaliella salina TaxID=3046 RepID=A0ABQ7H5P7_DUNSA|nr:putative phosphatidylinositol monophosphate kinase [Dunaliella salina]|eukprot:KAF5842183.1 putative phosphatidylinositol monophosphate kinase [Dunaliella salina]